MCGYWGQSSAFIQVEILSLALTTGECHTQKKKNPEILLEIARSINTNRTSIDEEVPGEQKRHQ